MVNNLLLLLSLLLFTSFSNCIEVSEELILRGEPPQQGGNYSISGTFSIVDAYVSKFQLGDIDVAEEGKFFFSATSMYSCFHFHIFEVRFQSFENHGTTRLDFTNYDTWGISYENVSNFGDMALSNAVKANCKIESLVNEGRLFLKNVVNVNAASFENNGEICLGARSWLNIYDKHPKSGPNGCISLAPGGTVEIIEDLSSSFCFQGDGADAVMRFQILKNNPDSIKVAQFGGEHNFLNSRNLIDPTLTYRAPYLYAMEAFRKYTFDIGFGYDEKKFRKDRGSGSVSISYMDPVPDGANKCPCKCEFTSYTVPGTLPTISTQTSSGRTRTLTITFIGNNWTTIVDPDPTSKAELTTSEPKTTTSEEESTIEPDSAASEIKPTLEPRQLHKQPSETESASLELESRASNYTEPSLTSETEETSGATSEAVTTISSVITAPTGTGRCITGTVTVSPIIITETILVSTDVPIDTTVAIITRTVIATYPEPVISTMITRKVAPTSTRETRGISSDVSDSVSGSGTQSSLSTLDAIVLTAEGSGSRVLSQRLLSSGVAVLLFGILI
ncbi:uncharacterized protein J8A68_003742 [[Candida] subhashii]|uniref:Hyphally-regulated cell wall protein N-terminal domain-containing protein n=1 Tax=[Candida] subhashii TaxID=561895 RepID=A0A8J5QIU0_9ASCO|nr:uncharacterized protein J8A68_003742 [[Candida] subhashii]KAG7662754.1 hypothetical protein J8A68_003742 [[Candida] subhashii]